MSNSSQVFGITVLTPHESWLLVNFGEDWDNPAIAGDDVDGDNDGVGNLLERAFGGDPNVTEDDLLPKIDPSAPWLGIVYRKAVTATDLTSAVQESTDLSPAWDPATGSSEIISDDGTVQWIRFIRPSESKSRLFLRVGVLRP